MSCALRPQHLGGEVGFLVVAQIIHQHAGVSASRISIVIGIKTVRKKLAGATDRESRIHAQDGHKTVARKDAHKSREAQDGEVGKDGEEGKVT